MSAPSSSTGFSAFGNGSGYLYIVNPDGTTINASLPNDSGNAVAVLANSLTAAPSSGEILATGTVQINVGAGTVTTCTVNGVDIMGATAASGATPALIATDLASKINSTVSVPEYTATVIGSSANIVQIKAAIGSGSTPNGLVVSAGVTAPTTVTTSDMNGGVDGSGLYSPTLGTRVFINALSSATEGTLVGATEITAQVTKRGLESQLYTSSVDISNGIIAPTRAGSILIVAADTQGGAATDDLDTIDPGIYFQNQDIIIIRGISAARVITVKDTVGNIFLTNNTDWVSGDLQNNLILQYQTPVGGTNGWYEISRSATLPTVAVLRGQSIPQPASGLNVVSMATSGTFDFVPGTDKAWQSIQGSPVLIGNLVFQPDPLATPLDGDWFVFEYRATPTIGVNTVTLGNITLTDAQAAGGNVVVYAVYHDLTTTWKYWLLPKANGVDMASVAYAVATYEPLLPASGGDTFVLQKTVGGAYSFVPNGGDSVLTNTTANASTTAVITKEILATYDLPANTSTGNGDIVIIRGVWQTAANANAKTVGIDFGATTVASYVAALNANTVVATCIINRMTSATQSATGQLIASVTATGDLVSANSKYTTPAENFAADITITAWGQNGVASASDIISRQFSVEIYKQGS